jgi:hypothetical protein
LPFVLFCHMEWALKQPMTLKLELELHIWIHI